MKLAHILVLIACVACRDAAHPLAPVARGTFFHVEVAPAALDAAAAQIEVVIALVHPFCAGSVLNTGQCRALAATLEAAHRSVLAGNKAAAIGQLGAFISQVIAFGRTGRFDPDATQTLINEAGKAIALLDG